MEHGDIPACYVSLPEGTSTEPSWSESPRESFVGILGDAFG